jgi:hypothetical protein
VWTVQNPPRPSRSSPAPTSPSSSASTPRPSTPPPPAASCPAAGSAAGGSSSAEPCSRGYVKLAPVPLQIVKLRHLDCSGRRRVKIDRPRPAPPEAGYAMTVRRHGRNDGRWMIDLQIETTTGEVRRDRKVFRGTKREALARELEIRGEMENPTPKKKKKKKKKDVEVPTLEEFSEECLRPRNTTNRPQYFRKKEAVLRAQVVPASDACASTPSGPHNRRLPLAAGEGSRAQDDQRRGRRPRPHAANSTRLRYDREDAEGEAAQGCRARVRLPRAGRPGSTRRLGQQGRPSVGHDDPDRCGPASGSASCAPYDGGTWISSPGASSCASRPTTEASCTRRSPAGLGDPARTRAARCVASTPPPAGPRVRPRGRLPIDLTPLPQGARPHHHEGWLAAARVARPAAHVRVHAGGAQGDDACGPGSPGPRVHGDDPPVQPPQPRDARRDAVRLLGEPRQRAGIVGAENHAKKGP